MGKREMRERAIEFLDGLLEVEQRWDRELEEVRVGQEARMDELGRQIRRAEEETQRLDMAKLGSASAAQIDELGRRVRDLEARVAHPLHDGVLADRISELEGWRESHEAANERSWADWKGWADRLEELERLQALASKDWLVGVERREKDRVVERLERLEEVGLEERDRRILADESHDARLTALEGERLIAQGVRIGEIPIDTAARLAALEANANDASLALEVARGVSTELGVFKPEMGARLEPLERLFSARPDLQAELEGRIAALEGDVDAWGKVEGRARRLADLEQQAAVTRRRVDLMPDPRGRISALEVELGRLVRHVEGGKSWGPGLVYRVEMIEEELEDQAKARLGDDPRPTAAEAAERAVIAGRAGIRLETFRDTGRPTSVQLGKPDTPPDCPGPSSPSFPAAPEQGRPERIGPGKYVEEKAPLPDIEAPLGVQLRGLADILRLCEAGVARRLDMLAAVADGLAGLARKAVPSIAGKEGAEAPVYLRRLADELEGAARLGARWDSPEGSRWIQISDDLARAITNRLRTIAGVLEASG